MAAGDSISGSIAAWHGNLDVSGRVSGNAVAIGGDVVLHPGAVVGGDALAVGGEVRNEGGTVDGEMRSLSALTVGPLPTAPPRSAAQTARRSVSLAVGWYLVLAAIGLAVVLFARGNLETISDRIRRDFTRSFLYGLAGQLLLVPALLVVQLFGHLTPEEAGGNGVDADRVTCPLHGELDGEPGVTRLARCVR